MAKDKEQPIVAELGRAETVEETAARKAENSRLHRQRQTVNNLALSLLASLGLVLVLVLIVPRGVGDFETRSVDVAALATQAENTAGQELVSPNLPEDWLAKQALIRSSRTDQVTHWYIGYTTPSVGYAGIMQAFTPDLEPANETWVAEQLERKLATGTETYAGVEWTVYDHRNDSADETNVTYALSTKLEHAMLIVYGTAEPAEIKILAKTAIESLKID